MPPALTPTSFAILGLLCVRPWSAYDLAAQMQRGWRFTWPRARSGIYEEPKKLVAHGYADASVDGRRTVYTATATGRRAFRDWLDTEPSEPRFEWEGLLHVLFGDLGSKEQLLAALRTMNEQAEHDRDALIEQATGYLDDGGPFPERRHLMVLVGDLVHRQAELLAAWAQDAEAEVRGWPDTVAPYGERRLRSRLRAILAVHEKP